MNPKGERTGPGRRTFLKTVAFASGLPSVSGKPPIATTTASTKSSAPVKRSRAAPIDYPRKFTGANLPMIAFPLGGVGAGSISLGGRGQLRDWEIFNRPDKRRSPEYAFAAIRVQRGIEKPYAAILESRIQPPYEGASGLGSANVPGMPRLANATFTGEFPLARIDFSDPALPVNVAMEAFSPFIPLDAEESGLPVAILRYRVTNPAKTEAKVSIAFSLDNPITSPAFPGGTQILVRRTNAGQGLLYANGFLAANDAMKGTIALMTPDASADVTTLQWRGGTGWRVGPLLFWDQFKALGHFPPPPQNQPTNTPASLCIQRTIPGGADADFTFLLSWHFPNRTPERCGWTAPQGHEKDVIGNGYTQRFKDAWEAAEYTAGNLGALERRTRAFATALRETTLPSSVKEAASANLSTLVTPTSFRTSDGAFHGFEGCNDTSGCCYGSCTHVWNYETATAFLFPSLARSLRESLYGFSTDEKRFQAFREKLPDKLDRMHTAAADGQMGQIMHLYLDWTLSGDLEWLKQIWPAAKRALEFAWIQGGWDPNRDGVMEGPQHNTYDVEFYGPNPLCGIWYLGALRAATEMARAVGDHAAATEYTRLFENGSKWIDSNLFNGEYFIQKVHGIPKDQISPALLSGMGASNTDNPDFQVGEGCLVDQLAGQYMADICALGNLVDPGKIAKTLESIYKYNYKRTMFEHESVQRTYALNDEAALVICDYANKPRPEVPFPYFAEVMTGFEYTAATLMLAHDMLPHGVEVIGNIRRRYDGLRRNPWNEAECGHHYARAMASWSPMVVLSGFNYHAPSGLLAIRPKATAPHFRSFWSTATGWGTFTHTGDEITIEAIEGTLPIAAMETTWQVRSATHGSASVTGRPEGNRFVLSERVSVKPGVRLVLRA